MASLNADQKLVSWLQRLGLDEHVPGFTENGVDFDLLPELSNDDLKDLGVARLADRKRLLAAIAQLADQPDPAPSPTPHPHPAAAQAPLLSERRQVTILFADLSGFTDLSTRLDAEDLHELLTRYYRLVDGIIARYGGTVDKHIGDGVMSLFGAPVAHGDDPLRAVRAAFDIHEGMAALAAELSQPLSVHIGIAAGAVIAGGLGSEGFQEYTVIGDSVNLASRLDGVARSGETVIDSEVQRAVASAVKCADLGEMQIKGIETPVQVWRAEALLGSDEDQRLTKFVGRRSELRQFQSALAYCVEDRAGQIILVRGEAGIGKSRLLREFIKSARALNFTIHRALVLDFGAGTGQDAIRTLVRSILGADGSAGSDLAARVADAVAAGWIEPGQAKFLQEYLDLANTGEAGAAKEILDATVHQAELQRLLSNLLGNAAGGGDMVLFVEDIHWADPEVLRQLAVIAAQVRDAPVLLVMTTRVDGDPTDTAWRKSTLGAQILTIDLGPLRETEALELAQDFARRGNAASERCVERADGNPLFLEQLLRNAAETDDETVPGSIQSIVLARIDRLDPSDKGALQAAAVIGQRFSLEALRHLIANPAFDVENLVNHELIRAEGAEYLFTHALIRDSVYSALLRQRLRDLHLRAAAFFAATDPVLHAEHLDRAGDVRAAPAYLVAAQAQAKTYQYDRALALLERGQVLAEDAQTRFLLTDAKAKLQHDMAQVEQSIHTYGELIDLAGTDEQKCRAWLGMASAMRLADRYKDALGFLDLADEVAQRRGNVAELAQIHSQRGSLFFSMGRTEECAAEHEISLEYAERAGLPELEATALSGVADARYVVGRMATALGYFQRSVETAAAVGFPGIESVNLAMASLCEYHNLNLGKALDMSHRAIAIAAEAGFPRSLMLGNIAAFVSSLEVCDVADARHHVEATARLASQLGAPRFEAQSAAFSARLSWIDGDRDTAISVLREAFEISAGVGHGFTGPRIQGVLALCLEDPQERRAALAEGERLLAAGAVSHNFLEFYPDAIDVSLDLEDWQATRRYAAALEEYTRAEPLAFPDFLIARGRALADWGEGRRDAATRESLQALDLRAKEAGIVRAADDIRAALAAV